LRQILEARRRRLLTHRPAGLPIRVHDDAERLRRLAHRRSATVANCEDEMTSTPAADVGLRGNSNPPARIANAAQNLESFYDAPRALGVDLIELPGGDGGYVTHPLALAAKPRDFLDR
jgi:hypothetical protein